MCFDRRLAWAQLGRRLRHPGRHRAVGGLRAVDGRECPRLGVLLSVSTVAFDVLKIIGATYLIYLGVRMLLSGAQVSA